MIAIHRFLAPLAASLLVACSGSDPEAAPSDAGGADTGELDTGNADTGGADTDGDDGGPDAAGGYDVEYLAVGDGLTVGKSRFQLRVTHHAGGAATGLADQIAISPVMAMAKMSHGNPVPPDAVKESATPGTYDVTSFFTMASVDESGNPAGQWTLEVGVGAQPKVPLAVTVARASGPDTTHRMLRNADDTIGAMGSSKMRNWVLFRDALEKDGAGHRVRLFLATVQDGMMVWPPVTTGLKLVDASGKVQLQVESLGVHASSDGTTWAPMTCDATARCTATLAGLATTGKVLVKLQVNGKDYTTDGAAPNGDADPAKNNAWATFTVTPS